MALDLLLGSRDLNILQLLETYLAVPLSTIQELACSNSRFQSATLKRLDGLLFCSMYFSMTIELSVK